MKKKYNVSVIVPVYNVEKYLDKCLNSLARQTLASIQIIIVNDGTKDNSQNIIDKYVENYPERMFSYIKENGGLSDARNFGLQYAEGEYIGFVDSDDWVDEKMFELMFEFASKNNHQIVSCDIITINDGWEKGYISNGYRGKNPYPESKDYLLYSLEPAHVWNKLYYYQLFNIEKFPIIWYEDIATTPILLSYAESIGYLRIPLYYYRQRSGSITQAHRDPRSLQVIDAWKNIINRCNRIYVKEITAAVYKSVLAFTYFKPEYANEYIQYLNDNKKKFLGNDYINNYTKNGEYENLFAKTLIPKKIHYFWFGGGKKSDLANKCIESWKKYAPDYEIIEWNETNCDVAECDYVKEAYQSKKWAFVSDYFRIKKIYEYGGIYVDTDTEFVNDISSLRLNNAFFAFETKQKVHAGIFGAIKGFPLIKKWLDTYTNSHLIKKDGFLDTSNTIVVRLTKLLESEYGINLNGQEQYLKFGVKIYSPNVLTLDMYDGKCIAQHHYEASWWDTTIGVVSYKNIVLKDYFSYNGTGIIDIDNISVDALKIQLQQMEESTCWKITAPLRLIGDLVKRIKRSFHI